MIATQESIFILRKKKWIKWKWEWHWIITIVLSVINFQVALEFLLKVDYDEGTYFWMNYNHKKKRNDSPYGHASNNNHKKGISISLNCYRNCKFAKFPSWVGIVPVSRFVSNHLLFWMFKKKKKKRWIEKKNSIIIIIFFTAVVNLINVQAELGWFLKVDCHQVSYDGFEFQFMIKKGI